MKKVIYAIICLALIFSVVCAMPKDVHAEDEDFLAVTGAATHAASMVVKLTGHFEMPEESNYEACFIIYVNGYKYKVKYLWNINGDVSTYWGITTDEDEYQFSAAIIDWDDERIICEGDRVSFTNYDDPSPVILETGMNEFDVTEGEALSLLYYPDEPSYCDMLITSPDGSVSRLAFNCGLTDAWQSGFCINNVSLPHSIDEHGMENFTCYRSSLMPASTGRLLIEVTVEPLPDIASESISGVCPLEKWMIYSFIAPRSGEYTFNFSEGNTYIHDRLGNYIAYRVSNSSKTFYMSQGEAIYFRLSEPTTLSVDQYIFEPVDFSATSGMTLSGTSVAFADGSFRVWGDAECAVAPDGKLYLNGKHVPVDVSVKSSMGDGRVAVTSDGKLGTVAYTFANGEPVSGSFSLLDSSRQWDCVISSKINGEVDKNEYLVYAVTSDGEIFKVRGLGSGVPYIQQICGPLDIAKAAGAFSLELDSEFDAVYVVLTNGNLIEIVDNIVCKEDSDVITRGESAYFITKTMKLNDFSDCGYSDIADSPYKDAINAATNAHYFSGTPSGNFSPDTAITRAQMLVFVMNTFGELNIVSRPAIFDEIPGAIGSDHWASRYYYSAYDIGLIGAEDLTDFNSPATREFFVKFAGKIYAANNIIETKVHDAAVIGNRLYVVRDNGELTPRHIIQPSLIEDAIATDAALVGSRYLYANINGQILAKKKTAPEELHYQGSDFIVIYDPTTGWTQPRYSSLGEMQLNATAESDEDPAHPESWHFNLSWEPVTGATKYFDGHEETPLCSKTVSVFNEYPSDVCMYAVDDDYFALATGEVHVNSVLYVEGAEALAKTAADGVAQAISNTTGMDYRPEFFKFTAEKDADYDITLVNISGQPPEARISTFDADGVLIDCVYSSSSSLSLAKNETCYVAVTVYEDGASFIISSDAIALSLAHEGESSIAVRKGDSFSITIAADYNPGFISLQTNLVYDTHALRLTGVADKGLLGSFTSNTNLATRPYPLIWQDALSKTNMTATGEMVTLTFEVIGDATLGSYVISLSDTVAYDTANDPVVCNSSVFTVDVVPFFYGDVDDDGEIGLQDVMYLLNHIVQQEGYTVLAHPEAADVDGRAGINVNDAVTILRKVAGWTKYQNLPLIR